MSIRTAGLFVGLLTALTLAMACVTRQPATDVGDSASLGPSPTRGNSSDDKSGATAPTTPTTPTTPTAPTTPTTPVTVATIAYTPDLVPIFQADCVRCHSGSRPDGNYNMTTYAGVMRGVVAGNARSRLVVTAQRNASMYRYWSGNAAAKAELVRAWVVDNRAAETR